MLNGHTHTIETTLNRKIARVHALHGGSIAQVFRVWLDNGESVVAKIGQAGGSLHIEGRMLHDLRSNLPVPEVLHAAPDLLLMTHIRGDSTITGSVQAHAADLLGALHQIRGDAFGYGYDTLIGGLHQPNPQTASWVDFFRDSRLLYMAHDAHNAGELPAGVVRRIESFAAKIGDFIGEPAFPALIHGDMWTTNILAADGRVTGFIDPAIYYAHPEIELAFSTLFGTFGNAFFQRYAARYGMESGFFESRRDIYNLYPLLVHVRLFGGGYVRSVERILAQNGF